jgi:hypothetical protein
MSFGDPLLMSGNKSHALLTRVSLQDDSDQTYKERALQELIDSSPNVLPISDFYPSVEQVCSLGREIPVPVGGGTECSIDNLLVTNDAHLIVVETKLWRNREGLRDVVAQSLQYTMALSQLSPTEFERRLRRGLGQSHRLGPEETVSQRSCDVFTRRTDDFDEAIDRLRQNGDMLVLIVGDGIRLSAERLVEWMNRAVGIAPYRLGLVELRFYELPDGARIIVPKSLLRIGEGSRHVVTINLQGAGREHVTATFATNELPTTTKITVPSNPLSEQGLTTQIRAKNPPEIADLAETMRAQVKAAGMKTRGLPSCINYGIEVDGDFITIFSVTATNIWMSIPLRAVRALGDQQFVACKLRMNSVGEFYRPEDVSDPTRTTALGPRFRVLDGKVESFVEAVSEVSETLRGAVTEAS